MFQPSQADVRRFFCGVYAKSRNAAPMEAIETLAALWIDEHPEFHAELSDLDAALRALDAAQAGTQAGTQDHQHDDANAFLHLAMHLSISEQCSIDQPAGIRQAVELLTARLDDLHAAHHASMDCLGQMVDEAARSGRAPDGPAYIACVQRRATRD